MATMSHFYRNTTLHLFVVRVSLVQLAARTEIVHTVIPVVLHAHSEAFATIMLTSGLGLGLGL